MKSRISHWLSRFMPEPNTGNHKEQMRACLGALFGLVWTGLISYAVSDNATLAINLIAPMGASAVLLFCAPGSPLAQPWSIIGGNLVSGLIGVTCARFIGDVVLAASVAGCLAIAAMFALRCLHPPSGAVALTAVLGGPMVQAAGYHFVLMPIGLNSLLLVAAALFFNNVTGRRYPHSQHLHQQNPQEAKDHAPMGRLGFTIEDLNTALQRYNQVLDISRDDLESIFLQTEMSAYHRRFGVITCAEIMSKEVVTVVPTTVLNEAWHLMRDHRLKALPVLDQERHVIGIVTQTDFLQYGEWDEDKTLRMKFRFFCRSMRHSFTRKLEVVDQIMAKPVKTARDSAPIIELVPLMINSGLQHIPIVDAEDRIVGMVAQVDLVAAIYENRVATAST